MKTKHITVVALSPSLFRVTKAQDQVEHLPGKELTVQQVTDLCSDRNWKVIILDDRSRGL